MQAVDAGRPLRGRMLQQRRAVGLQIRRQLHFQWVLNLARLQEHAEQRRSREVCDGESLADEIRTALPLALDAVERCCDDGPIPLQIAPADAMTESVERWEKPEQWPKRAVGL